MLVCRNKNLWACLLPGCMTDKLYSCEGKPGISRSRRSTTNPEVSICIQRTGFGSWLLHKSYMKSDSLLYSILSRKYNLACTKYKAPCCQQCFWFLQRYCSLESHPPDRRCNRTLPLYPTSSRLCISHSSENMTYSLDWQDNCCKRQRTYGWSSQIHK